LDFLTRILGYVFLKDIRIKNGLSSQKDTD
jgi:hypothetical protein